MFKILFRSMVLPALILSGALIADTDAAGGANYSQSPSRLFRFVAFGDMGTGDKDQQAVADAMTKMHGERPFDTVLMLGDNIYPDGNPADLPAKFERPYAALLKSNVRFYATLGNHDVKKGRQAQINYPHFNMGGRAYYSFVKGDGVIEFFSLDTTEPDAAQMRWLDDALAASTAKWKVVFFHFPIYSSGKTHGSDKKLREVLEPLLVKHGVAAAFSGHDHTYERTVPQQGVQYFVSGTGGKLRKGDLDGRSPLLAAGDDQHNSFMLVEVTETEIRFSAVSSDGQILDSGTILPATAEKRAGVR